MYLASFNNEIVTLQSPTSKVSIWPKYGAILNNWQVQLHHKQWDVVDGYESFEDFEKNCESKGFRSCKLSPFVCRMKHSSYEFEGNRFTTNKFDLLGHGIHGLIYNDAFEFVNTSANDNEASVTLLHNYIGKDAGYPFHFTVEVVYTLTNNNTLTLETTVVNKSASAIPLSDGWHPYFSLGRKIDELQFYMAANTIVEFDEELLPTGNLKPFDKFQQPDLLGATFLDNCFVLNNLTDLNACRLLNNEDNIQLTISANENYPYLQVYTPPHRNSIAVENLSSVPDSFNNGIGLSILAGGEQKRFTCSYRVSEID